MFKGLRRSFIRMNMLVISLLMLASFSVVYILVYSSTRQEIAEELSMLLSVDEHAFGRDDMFPPQGQQPLAPGEAEPPFSNVPRIGFVVRLAGDEYEIVQARMFFLPDEFDIPAMLQQVENGSGSFTLDEHVWTYRTLPGADGSTRVAFVETSESQALLVNLIRIFVLIAVVLLVAIWFVSRWFAKRSVAPIEQAYNNQRRFIQDASHDLKTPVAVIKTNVELLASHPGESVASQEEWIDNIKAETTRMEHLTARLLTLARAEADVPQKAKQRFVLSEAVQNCILPLEAVLFEKNLHFESRVEEGIELNGDEEDIQRLVHILMENAIQYTPEGGRVSLTLARDKSRAVLRVANTGEGIPEADLPHVFDRFYRGDAARSRQTNSYGLGLAIAQGIAQRHRGGIAAQSTPGAETVFTVTLPAAL